MSKKFLFLSIFMGCFSLVYAQKKALSHDDYDQWKSISNYQLSKDGKFLIWTVKPQVGNSFTIVQDFQNQTKDTLFQVASFSFAYQEKYLVGYIQPEYSALRTAKLKKEPKKKWPKKDLLLWDISQRNGDTLKGVKSFVSSEQSNLLSALLEPRPEPKDTTVQKEEKSKKKPLPGDVFLALNLGDTQQVEIPAIKWMLMAEEGNEVFLYREKGDSSHASGLFKMNENLTHQIVDTNAIKIEKMSFSKDGLVYAYLACVDSTKDNEKWEVRGLKKKGFVIDGKKGLPENWVLNPHHAPKISDDGADVFVSTYPKPKVFEKDTTILKEEVVKVDVWSYRDTTIQPYQLKNAKREAKKGYWAYFNGRKLIPVQDEQLGNIRIPTSYNSDWLVATDSRPYQLEMSWSYPWKRDVYLVNKKNGKQLLVAQGVASQAELSPDEKYVYWYDVETRNYLIKEKGKKETRNLSKSIDLPLYNVESDVPAEPGAYGSLGFTADGQHVVLYTQFDMWRVNVESLVAENLTNRAASKTKFRYVQLDRKEQFLPKDRWLLRSFSEETKEEGLYWYSPESNKLVEMEKGPWKYYGVTKAEGSDRIIVRRGNFQSYYDLYELGENQALSNTNPQQENFKWGTVELVKWNAKNKGQLEGLLYKPEGFDSGKQYPMLVYFYETYSDQLHAYKTPAPSASTINIPYFLGQDYLVFIPDIKYETGQPGQDALDCITSGTKYIMEKGYVLNDKIGIQGQSWGGYQVAYLVTQTNLYAAGMAGAPVSNMLSAYGGIRWGSGFSREFQYEQTQSRLGVTPWENLDTYLKNSPVVFADRVETPLLIMHNDNDGAVPWYQGIEYFMALRRLQKPVWMLVYNGEEHNLMKRHNRMDLSIRMGQFFDHYLKDKPAPLWMTNGIPATEKTKNYGFELNGNVE